MGTYGDLLSYLARDVEIGRYFPAGLPAAPTLAGVFDAATAQLKSAYPAYATVNVDAYLPAREGLKAAKDQKSALRDVQTSLEAYANTHLIGLYSYEQEADELSGEFLNAIGVDPEASVDVDMQFVKLYGEGEPIGWDECSQLRESGWRRTGTPVIVPIGYLEFHHQDCFRAFNLDRDIVAHGYTGPYPTAFLADGEWTALQTALPVIGHTSAPRLPTEQGIGFSCAYGDVRFRF